MRPADYADSWADKITEITPEFKENQKAVYEMAGRVKKSHDYCIEHNNPKTICDLDRADDGWVTSKIKIDVVTGEKHPEWFHMQVIDCAKMYNDCVKQYPESKDHEWPDRNIGDRAKYCGDYEPTCADDKFMRTLQ